MKKKKKVDSSCCVSKEKSISGKYSSGDSGFFSFFHRFDLLQFLPVIVLLTFGVLFIYGTGQQIGGFAAETYWKRHLTYMLVGFGVWLFFSILDYRWMGPVSSILYPISIGLLVFVLFCGQKYFGARSWLQVGSVNFQPSEIAKFSLILLAAWGLSFKTADINRFLWMILVCIFTGIPFLLIAKQPDFGSAMSLIPSIAGIIFCARLKWRYILIVLALIAILTPTAYFFVFRDYQKARILNFLDPERDPRNTGWSQIQAEMAVGTGGFKGKGFMKGSHNLLGYLPQTVSNSDFIFPVIAEETGFLGAGAVVLAFMVLLFSIFRTALAAPDDFGSFLCIGIGMLIFFHVFVNIGMNVRLCPVTGLPLPLVSYGGTFLVSIMAYLGIVQSVYAHREKRSFLGL